MLLGKKLMIILTSFTGAILVTFYSGYMVNLLPSFTTIFDQIRKGEKLVGLSDRSHPRCLRDIGCPDRPGPVHPDRHLQEEELAEDPPPRR
jgi:hypothetical protein